MEMRNKYLNVINGKIHDQMLMPINKKKSSRNVNKE